MRNVLIRSVLALATLAGPALPLEAGCNVYPSYSYSYPSYAPAHVEVKKVVAVEYVPLAVLVPQYAVGYAPPAPPAPALSSVPGLPAGSTAPAQAQTTTPCDERVKALDAKLAA